MFILCLKKRSFEKEKFLKRFFGFMGLWACVCAAEIEKNCEQKHQTVNESAHQILPPVGQHVYGPVANDITLPCPPVH